MKRLSVLVLTLSGGAHNGAFFHNVECELKISARLTKRKRRNAACFTL
jgi:hypothetical protein